LGGGILLKEDEDEEESQKLLKATARRRIIAKEEAVEKRNSIRFQIECISWAKRYWGGREREEVNWGGRRVSIRAQVALLTAFIELTGVSYYSVHSICYWPVAQHCFNLR
jgi:hypothetical protein